MLISILSKCFRCSNESNQKAIRDRSSKVEISSTLIGRNHGFKKYRGFQPSTSTCRLRIFASDRTTPASSNLSSTERCNCGQWSSTVREPWPSASLCAARLSRRQLAHSLVSLARMRARSLVRHQALQQEASRHQASGCYKEDVDLLLLNRTTRNGSSSKTSPRKYRMMQGRHA
jgi:hypothetical protein